MCSNAICMPTALETLHLISHPITCCFSSTVCHPEKQHLSRGCLLPHSPAGNRTRVNFCLGVPASWRTPARDGAADADHAAGSLLSISFVPLRWHCCGWHLTMGPLSSPGGSAVLELWAVPDVSLTFTSGCIQQGSGLLGKWFPP